MTNPPLESIPVILATTMLTEKWDVSLPLDIPVQGIIAKIVANPALPFPQQDQTGNVIPYRLMWQERNRFLGVSETLRSAQVEAGHTLIMTREARAGDRTAGAAT
ncbi:MULTISPECIES: hypothetical protein [Micromonospora]|uniref:Uncharacterized protein n=1 Tax=Micromonospora antibiotica TaxID=2807623 RepID=A0ABS3V4D4_9ACTN|nr:hypothetical protein [Micromonospora antibiotica]MBO4160483.1 hypothetical protein [Micromonospora antibiotica]